MFAILLQALLPIAQASASMAQARLDGGTIAGLDIAEHLCHASGDTAPDDPGRAPLDQHECCAHCLAAHAVGGFAPPVAPTVAIGRDYAIVVLTETTLVLPRQRSTLRQQQPRAPPVLI